MVGTMTSNITDTQTSNTVLHIYLNLRPGTPLVRKCYTHLQDTIANHPDAEVSLAGIATEGEQILLTIAVDLGAIEGIAQFSDPAIAGYNFVTDVCTDMFEYLPQYADAPDDAARAAAAVFADQMAEAVTINRAVNAY